MKADGTGRVGRGVLVLLAVALSGACGLDGIQPGVAVPTTPAPAEGLARPRVAMPEAGRPRYERERWQPHGWADADGDGCNTREEVLLSQGRGVQTGPGCKILAGEWVDRFTGRRTTSPAELQIDHLVALADAHRSGGWAWPDSRKEAFANDVDDGELNAVWGPENQAKDDDGPDRWLPPNPEARCWYVSTYARIKAQWDLTVTPLQWAAIERVWSGCGTGRPAPEGGS